MLVQDLSCEDLRYSLNRSGHVFLILYLLFQFCNPFWIGFFRNTYHNANLSLHKRHSPAP